MLLAGLNYPRLPLNFVLQDLSLKTYRSARALLGEVKRLLAENKPSAHRSPLVDVIELLCEGRHYTWMGIYLLVGPNTPQQLLEAGRHPNPGQLALLETRSKILVSMKLAGREIGLLDLESYRGNAFGAAERNRLDD